MKYGVTKNCKHCGNEFVTKPRYVDYCSQPCKNPNNRKGHIPWNKGIKLTEEQKAKQNTEGLEKGRGWNKGRKNPVQAKKWTGENNPNWNGKLNNQRPKNPVDDEFILYKSACKKATYRSVRQMKSEGLVPKTGKRKTDLQLDHIIPYKQGYELNLAPEIIGSRANLQYILGAENRAKWDTFQSDNIVQHIVEEFNNGL